MEFQAWPKTPRFFRTIVVSEKIDGTNAAIIIEKIGVGSDVLHPGIWPIVKHGDDDYYVGAQSRNRLIFPGKDTDNYGFASWVRDNAADLVSLLGEGRHFGEWWGKGIGRNYGVGFRQFSLFNTDKWGRLTKANEVPFDSHVSLKGGQLGAVPVLYHGEFSERYIQECLYDLQTLGSVAAPGFAKAEGICVYHTLSRQVYKVTLDNNDNGKWEAQG